MLTSNLATRQEIEQWLQEGVAAAKAGQVDRARFLLLEVVEKDQTNEAAWFWLYQLFDRNDDKCICLENLVTINPRNEWARAELLKYQGSAAFKSGTQSEQQAKLKKQSAKRKRPAASSPRPVTLKLITAFWTGISLVFLGSGFVAAANWLISGARTRTFPNYITGYQAFELLVAIIFIITGIMGLIVATALYSRTMAGFYSSIVLALGLLLIGPTVSLIVDPPNYLTMLCTGGISGMMVLLTLASQAGFEDTQ